MFAICLDSRLTCSCTPCGCCRGHLATGGCPTGLTRSVGGLTCPAAGTPTVGTRVPVCPGSTNPLEDVPCGVSDCLKGLLFVLEPDLTSLNLRDERVFEFEDEVFFRGKVGVGGEEAGFCLLCLDLLLILLPGLDVWLELTTDLIHVGFGQVEGHENGLLDEVLTVGVQGGSGFNRVTTKDGGYEFRLRTGHLILRVEFVRSKWSGRFGGAVGLLPTGCVVLCVDDCIRGCLDNVGLGLDGCSLTLSTLLLLTVPGTLTSLNLIPSLGWLCGGSLLTRVRLLATLTGLLRFNLCQGFSRESRRPSRTTGYRGLPTLGRSCCTCRRYHRSKILRALNSKSGVGRVSFHVVNPLPSLRFVV